MPELTEWLRLMLAEIARKREDAERAREEEATRSKEQGTARPQEPDRQKKEPASTPL